MSDSTDAGQGHRSYGRLELERDLVEWLEQQDFDQTEMDRVLEKLHALDHRALSDDFFSTLGTGGVDMGQFVSELLRGQPGIQVDQTHDRPAASDHQTAITPRAIPPREAEFQLRDVAARWEELDRETRELIRQVVMHPPADHVRKTIRSLLKPN